MLVELSGAWSAYSSNVLPSHGMHVAVSFPGHTELLLNLLSKTATNCAREFASFHVYHRLPRLPGTSLRLPLFFSSLFCLFVLFLYSFLYIAAKYPSTLLRESRLIFLIFFSFRIATDENFLIKVIKLCIWELDFAEIFIICSKIIFLF